MNINKKTRAVAACLLMMLLISTVPGCVIVAPPELSSVISGMEEGLYINGESVDVPVPEHGSYFYNQLTEAQKRMYSASVYVLEEGENTYELVGVNCDEYAKGCKGAVEALLRDRPDLFWIDGGTKITSTTLGGDSDGTIKIMLRTHDYWEKKDLSAAKRELEEAVLDLITQASVYTDDYEKAKFVNDWLAQNVEYDYDSFQHPEKKDEASAAFVNTIYGTLVARKTLCGGYAYTLSYILNRLGIEALYVTGTTKDGLHAWNMVNIGGEYYHIDPTWSDDNKNARIEYAYFCLDDAEMSLTHMVDEEFVYPAASGTEYNYYRREGLYLDSYSFNRFNSVFASHGLGDAFSVKFSNEVVLGAAVREIVENSKFYKLNGMENAKSFSYSVDDVHCILTLYP